MAEEPGTGEHFFSGMVGKMRGLFTTDPEAGGLGGTGPRGAAKKKHKYVTKHFDILNLSKHKFFITFPLYTKI